MRVREQFTLITITLFAAITRFWNLATPKGYVFDEVYYVDGAKDYLKYGVEVDKTSPEFIVHPPIGKWMISIGIKLFGDNEFGWRFMGALLGTLSIALIYLIAKQLFNSIFLATSAAAMMALDGLHLVLSRTALLDIYLMFFVLLAFFTFIREKYWWTGITLGLAIGAKWSGIYYLLTLLAIALFFEIKNRNVNKILKRITQLFFIPSLIYIFSWSGWIFSKRGWDRQWADERGGLFSFIPAPIRSLWHYHAEMLNFHTGLTEAHSYSANPWSWLILGRPTSFYYQSPNTCGSSSCAQEVVALGTPLLLSLIHI
jgi:dolichyl-phosphate-mannose-protein mannosyltransferase